MKRFQFAVVMVIFSISLVEGPALQHWAKATWFLVLAFCAMCSGALEQTLRR